jgi:hypothetical protein
MIETLQKTDYFSQRLSELGLKPEEAIRHGLDCDNDGNILQYIRGFNGNIIEYVPEFGEERKRYNKIANRSSSYNFLEETYFHPLFITRYTPENLALERAKALKSKKEIGKYKFPAKSYTGFSVLPMPNNEAIKQFKENKKEGTVSFIEGYFKAVAASQNGLEFTAFSGNTTYRLDEPTQEYLLNRQPSEIVIFYDGDATNISKKVDTVSSRRITDFHNSALNFSNQLFDFCKDNDLKPKVYYCQISRDLTAKGFDDLLKDARENENLKEVLEAFQTKENSQYFEFIRLYKTKVKKQLEEHFQLTNHVDFYSHFKEKIKEKPFIFRGAKYQIQKIFRSSDGIPLSSNQLTFGSKAFEYFNLLNNPFSIKIEKKIINVKKYISEAEAEVLAFINANNLLAINAPTGSGKTTLFIELSNRLKMPMVLCVPTILLCEQLTERYTKKGFNVYGIHGAVSQRKLRLSNNAQIIICTYDTLPKLNVNNRWLVIDEAHNLVNSYGLNSPFRENTIRKMVEMIDKPKKTILISGTQNKLLCKNLGFKYLEIKQKTTQKVSVISIENDKPDVAILERLKDTDWTDNKVHFVYLNDTSQLHIIKNFLVENGILTEEDVEVVSRADINGDTKKVYNQIVKTGKITGVKLVLATCIIAEGVDILNTNVGNIFTVKINCVDSLKQFSARFRLMEGVTVYSIRGKEKILSKGFFLNTEIEVERMEAEAGIKIRSMNHQREYNEHITDFSEADLYYYDDMNPTYNYKTDLFKNTYTTMEGEVAVDILRILAIERNRKLYGLNNAAFYSELAEHDNIILQGNETAITSKETEEAVEEIITTTKERKASSILLAKDLLLNNPSFLIEALFFHAKNRRSAIAAFITLTWYNGISPQIQSHGSLILYNAVKESFIQNWFTPIVRAFLILHYLDILEDNKDLIKMYSKSRFNTYFQGIKMASLTAIYLNKNYRKHLTKLHKTEIKYFKKLKQLLVVYIEAEGGRISEKKMVGFLRKKLMDSSLSVGHAKSILSNLFSFNIVRRNCGSIYEEFEEVFIEEDGKITMYEKKHFWQENEDNLLKIIDLVCTE